MDTVTSRTLPHDTALWWRRCAVVVPAAVLLATVMWLSMRGLNWWMTDSNVYQAAGRLVLSRRAGLYDLYLPNGDAPLWFNYPPFTALVLAPFALLPASALAILWISAKVLILLAVVWRTLDLLDVEPLRRWPAALLATLAVLLTDPVTQDIQVSNINIFLLLAFPDLTLPTRSRWKGIGVGLAMGAKITPALFVVYLLLTRQYRAARNAAITFVGTVALGLLILPAESLRYWTSALWDTSRVFPVPAFTGNLSLHGVLLRALGANSIGDAVWLVLAIATVVGGIAVAVGLHRRGDDLAGVLVCALLMVLASPISWSHHWVWCVPVIVAGWVHAWRAGSTVAWILTGTAVLMCYARLYIFATPGLDFSHVTVAEFTGMGAVPQLMAASLVIAGYLFVVLAEMHRRRLPPEHRVDSHLEPSKDGVR